VDKIAAGFKILNNDIDVYAALREQGNSAPAQTNTLCDRWAYCAALAPDHAPKITSPVSGLLRVAGGF